jgi:hypothetical protein
VNLGGETCQSLGHGNGALGCKPDCTWDFSGCDVGGPSCGAADACGGYTLARLKLSHLTAPAGDDAMMLKGVDLDGVGRTFDPRTDDVQLTFRDQGGVVQSATIPAGATGWQARPSNGPPRRFLFSDPTAAHSGIRKILLRAVTPAGFASRFRADVKLQNADLSGAADAAFLTANLRVGNDCWQEDAPCEHRGGGTARCRTPVRTCPGT